MTLQTLLDTKQITKYHLSKISGVPKTTVMDICAGRSSIERCSAKTVHQLSKALGCSMEDLLELDAVEIDERQAGLPRDKGYLECSLPGFLQESVDAMKTAWEKIDRDEDYLHYDCDYCSLQSDINNAEVKGMISTEQAWYLREKYLRMEKEEIV